MDLPKLTPEMGVRIDTLCELFFCQLMVFAKFLNEVPDKIEDEKYADFILYAADKRLKEIKDKKGIKYPKT